MLLKWILQWIVCVYVCVCVCVCVCVHARSRNGYVWLRRGSPVEVTWKQKRSLEFNETGNALIKQYWGAPMPQLLQWESNKYDIFWVCICSLSHTACNAHASYFRLWSARLCNIFPLHLTNGRIFEKKKSHLCVLISYATFCSKRFSC